MNFATIAYEAGCHLNSGCGFPAPNAHIFFLKPYVTLSLFGFEVTVTKSIILALIVALIVIAFFMTAFRSPKLVPGKLQSLGEQGYTFVRDQIAREVIGKDGDKFVPFLASLFFFIWICNLMGVIPGAQFPVMSSLAFPVALTLMVYITYVYLGMKHQGPIKFFTDAAFPPGVPKVMYVLLTPLELLGLLITRPVTQAIRLFANMFAGHLLITTFTVGAYYLLSPSLIGALGSATSFGVTIVLTGFEMFIQGLQAFIFTLLTAVYIGGSLHAEH
ncbi:MAG: ATP synthase F0 subunit A [Actinobacteria bacterium]|nr:ATP synthase F0 subunit A [Actinomycetota bacterium]NBY15682.1 ATP synthase F0 subunit A [Actinomycetota bacterium]